MRTAIDTNIISALWSEEASAPRIASRLWEAKSAGACWIAPVVYVELLAYPNATQPFLDGFLRDTGIDVEFQMEQTAWIEAGKRFAHYAGRRRKAGEGNPKRLLADFLVGAHALIHTDRLMTLDPTRYRQDFPELKLF